MYITGSIKKFNFAVRDTVMLLLCSPLQYPLHIRSLKIITFRISYRAMHAWRNFSGAITPRDIVTITVFHKKILIAF